MRVIASFVLATAIAAFAFSISASAKQARSTAAQTNQAVPDDFTEGNLKFHRVGGFLQVVDTAKNQTAGTVVFPPNAAPMFASMPGYDLKSAYEKHMKAQTAPSAATTTAVAGPAAATAPEAGFDAATKTAGLSDGRSVTFVDNDNLKVQMPGPAGLKTYDLHFHKASAGGFMKGWAGREQSRVGGSLGGGGVTISLAGQNGMPGGEVYDTAKGTVYGNSGLVQAKAVTGAVREAVEIAKSSGQGDVSKLNVVKSLLSNNLGF